MRTIYLNKKSEISALKESFEMSGAHAYRTKVSCDCNDGSRQAIIVEKDDKVILKAIRCKGCAGRKSQN